MGAPTSAVRRRGGDGPAPKRCGDRVDYVRRDRSLDSRGSGKRALMSPRIVVPDASVILKWVLPSADEPDLGLALALRDDIAGGRVRAVVPHLWLYEVGNTLTRRQPDRADRALNALLRFDFESALPVARMARSRARPDPAIRCDVLRPAYHAHAIEMRAHSAVRTNATSRARERLGFVTRLSELGSQHELNLPPGWSRPRTTTYSVWRTSISRSMTVDVGERVFVARGLRHRGKLGFHGIPVVAE